MVSTSFFDRAMARNFDSQNIVAKKNNVGNAQLRMELNRINREQTIEMRMHNVAKQRFKHKFAKLDVFGDNKGISEPSDVVMYQTHNPGFCYRRNGDCRLPQSNVTNLSVDFEDIHKLVFTKHEVDIEKVLFLYLLSTHRTNTLSPPPHSQKTSFLTREQSPLERLVDRSKKRQCHIYLPKHLPLYIIEIPCSSIKRAIIHDPRLTGKVIVNEKIMQLVQSVMVALKSANSERYDEMIALGNDANTWKDVSRVSRMSKFIKILEGQNLISSCESFYLIPHPPKHEVQTVLIPPQFHILERLIKNIRKNMFTIISVNSFSKVVPRNESSDDNNASQTTVESGKFFMDSSIISGSPSDELLMGDFVADSTQKEDEVLTLHSIMGLSSTILPRKGDKFDFKNPDIVSISNINASMIYSSEYELSTYLQTNSGSSSAVNTLDFEKVAIMLNQKVRRAIKHDRDKLYSDLAEKAEQTAKELETPAATPTSSHTWTSSDPTKEPSNKDPTPPVAPPKFSLRRTICAACRNKWRAPLPSPKLSTLRKVPIVQLSQSSLANISTPSSVRLSELIDEEYKKWELESPKSSVHSEQFTNKMYKSMARGSYIKNSSIEVVDLDELHLAKIRQEIKENETRKRLQNFLKS